MLKEDWAGDLRNLIRSFPRGSKKRDDATEILDDFDHFIKELMLPD